MRNLLFRNVTSGDKRRKILASSEFIEQKGVRSCVHRHLVCRIEEMPKTRDFLPRPTLYVVRRQDTMLRLEHFYCRIKGQMYLANNNHVFLVSFIHSLRIELSAIQKIYSL
jgi:hypothetical protein